MLTALSKQQIGLITLAALVLASIDFQRPAAASDAVKSVLERMEAVLPEWLPELGKCPADVMPAREIKPNYFKERCATTLEQCLGNCRAGDANECYAAALVLQEVRNGPVSEALFLRACALGIVSGCTNRAAGLDNSGPGDPCSIRTFERACDRNDPWACTMIGFHLVRGIGVAKDSQRAKQVLAKSCQIRETDPACGYAQGLLREIGE
jgi:hypothetical protein